MSTNQPTQVSRPWRATVRTLFQALVSFAALAPLLAAAVEEATGYDVHGVRFVVVALAVAAAITRIMAIPAVEAFLARFLPFLAADPASRTPGDAGAATVRAAGPPIVVTVLAVLAAVLLLRM